MSPASPVPTPAAPGVRAPWRAWRWYAAAGALLALLYLAGPLGSGPAFNLVGASAAVAIVVAVRRYRPRGRVGWWLIAGGQLLFVTGDALAYNHEALFGTPLPFPSLADPFYLAMYPCLVAGLVVLMRAAQPARDRGAVIDALVVTIGVGTLVWVFLMAPYAHDGQLTLLTKLVSLAYPAMDLLVLAIAARLVLRGGLHGPAGSMLAAGLVALMATDSVYGWISLHAGYDTGNLLDGGWIAFYLLLGTAALHPSMARLSEPAPGRTERLTRRRLVLFAVTSLIAPMTGLARSLLDLPREPALSVAAGALFVLVLARLAGLARKQEAETEAVLRNRFEARLAALVRHASDVVTLVGADGRVTYVSPSGGRLLGLPEDAILRRRWDALLPPDDVASARAFLDGLACGASGGLDHRIVRSDGTLVEVETLATNLLGDGTVDAVVLNTRDVTQRKELERRLAHRATHDDLTGLATRRVLEDRLTHALARRDRETHRVAVVFADLDDFKALNDTFGHAAGDAALCEVAIRLGGVIRAGDTAARLGGDEFVLLLEDLADADQAVATAARCAAALADPLVVDGHTVTLTATIGIAVDTPDTRTADHLLRRADAAMYRAKRDGKGRHLLFDERTATGAR